MFWGWKGCLKTRAGHLIAPVQKGIAKVVGLVLVAPRHPLQVKEELNIGDHGKPVHLFASVEEARILRDERITFLKHASLTSSGCWLKVSIEVSFVLLLVGIQYHIRQNGEILIDDVINNHIKIAKTFSTVFCKSLNYLYLHFILKNKMKHLLRLLSCFLFAFSLVSLEGKQFSVEFKKGSTPGLSADGAEYTEKYLQIENDVATFTHQGMWTIKMPDIICDAGSINFKLRLNHSLNAPLEGVPQVLLGNQGIFMITRKDGLQFSCYLCATSSEKTSVRVGVFTAEHKIVGFWGGGARLEVGKWYDFRLDYGKEIVMNINGQPLFTAPVKGLFGDAQSSLIERIHFGSPKYCSVFSITDFTAESRHFSEQQAFIPLVSANEPVLDGRLDDEFWRHCVSVTGFSVFKKSLLSPVQPILKIGYNEKGIFIASEVLMPEGTTPQASTSSRDGNVFLDDAFEVRFSTSPGKHHTFIANCIGTRFDALNTGNHGDTNFNPEWQVATQQYSNKWTFEAFLPYSALGMDAMPQAGDSCKGNFYYDRSGGFGGSLTWVPTNAMFDDMDGFGTLVFSGQEHALSIKRAEGFRESSPVLEFEKVGPLQPVVKLHCILTDNAGGRLSEYNFLMNDAISAIYAPKGLNSGVYGIQIQATDSEGKLLLNQKMHFQSDLKATLELERFPYLGKAELTVKVPNLLHNGKTTMIESTLILENGTVQESINAPLNGGSALLSFGIDEIPPQLCKIRTRLLDAKRGVLEEDVIPLKIYPKPEWFKNTLGIDRTVPPPWTPVQANSKSFKVWNREYSFNGVILPQSIVNGGREMLAEPISMRLKLAGKEEIELSALPAELLEAEADKATCAAIKELDVCTIKLVSALEFDGCFRGDLQIIPKDGKSVTIEKLTMSVKMLPEWSTDLLSGNGHTQTLEPVTEKQRNFRFTPYSWLGSVKGGLALFFESDEYWTQGNPNAMVVKRTQTCVAREFSIVDLARKLDAPLSMTWGLMASPVRPLPKEDLYRFAQHQCFARDYSDPCYVKYAKPGWKTQGSIQFFFKPLKERLKSSLQMLSLEAPRIRPLCIYLNCENTPKCVLTCDKTVKVGTMPLKTDVFSLFTLNNDGKKLELFIDAKCVISIPVDDTIAALWKAIGDEGAIFIGSHQEWNPNYSAMLIDDVRISETAQQADEYDVTSNEKSLFSDAFEDDFTPDGFATLDAAGALPSIGSVFVDNGRNGRGLLLLTELPKEGWRMLKENYDIDVALFWNWHNDHLSMYQWPPDFSGNVRKGLAEELVQAKKYGFKSMPYAIFPAIHYPSELAEQFGDEWKRKPVDLMPYPPPEGHYMLKTSLASKGWFDYLAAGIRRDFERLGWEGIYTDGGLIIGETANKAQGCGWTDSAGNIHVTYPFFAVRENVKRIYKIVKENPERIIINHHSFGMPLPTASFSDAILCGEHENYTLLDTVRIRFNGRPWGIPILLFGNSAHDWSALHTMTGLLVGDQIWGMTIYGRNEMSRKWLFIRKAFQRFGYKEARLIPFYEIENEILEPLDKDICAAAYVKQDGSMLLVVANYSSESRETTLRLKKTGFATAKSALNGMALPMKESTIKVNLLPENFQLIEIRPAAR